MAVILIIIIINNHQTITRSQIFKFLYTQTMYLLSGLNVFCLHHFFFNILVFWIAKTVGIMIIQVNERTYQDNDRTYL